MLKVNELVRQTLAGIIREEIEFEEGVIVSILRVDTSPDLRHAKVYVSILPEEKTKQTMAKLIREVKVLQHELATTVEMRNSPKIRFVIDEEEQKALEIDRLLDEVKKEIEVEHGDIPSNDGE